MSPVVLVTVGRRIRPLLASPLFGLVATTTPLSVTLVQLAVHVSRSWTPNAPMVLAAASMKQAMVSRPLPVTKSGPFLVTRTPLARDDSPSITAVVVRAVVVLTVLLQCIAMLLNPHWPMILTIPLRHAFSVVVLADLVSAPQLMAQRTPAFPVRVRGTLLTLHLARPLVPLSVMTLSELGSECRNVPLEFGMVGVPVRSVQMMQRLSVPHVPRVVRHVVHRVGLRRLGPTTRRLTGLTLAL